MRSEVIGFAMCGSFCTFDKVLVQAEALRQRFAQLVPVMSPAAFSTDTRFGPAAQFRSRLEAICNSPILHTITETEPFGPKGLLDLLVIAPCTGNTLAKLANGIADTAVTLACKAHLRNGRPVVIGVSTNDGLAGNAANIGRLLDRRQFYFIPFGQDAPGAKPASLVAKWEKLVPTVEAALEGRQLQPLLA